MLQGREGGLPGNASLDGQAGLWDGGCSPPVPLPLSDPLFGFVLQAGETQRTRRARWCTSSWHPAAGPGTTMSSACTRAAVPSTVPSCPRASTRVASWCPCPSLFRTSWERPSWPLTGKTHRLQAGLTWQHQCPSQAPES